MPAAPIADSEVAMTHYPPHGQSGQQAPPPVGHIAVTTRTPPMTQPGYKSFNKAQIFLDGYQMAHGWGRSVFPSWPGRHHLHVHVRGWGTNLYRADIEIHVHAGHLVELEYMVPWLAGAPSLTFAPRR